MVTTTRLRVAYVYLKLSSSVATTPFAAPLYTSLFLPIIPFPFPLLVSRSASLSFYLPFSLPFSTPFSNPFFISSFILYPISPPLPLPPFQTRSASPTSPTQSATRPRPPSSPSASTSPRPPVSRWTFRATTTSPRGSRTSPRSPKALPSSTCSPCRLLGRRPFPSARS